MKKLISHIEARIEELSKDCTNTMHSNGQIVAYRDVLSRLKKPKTSNKSERKPRSPRDDSGYSELSNFIINGKTNEDRSLEGWANIILRGPLAPKVVPSPDPPAPTSSVEVEPIAHMILKKDY